ncbi:hypothetical protein Tco_0709780 [Tanacetum coccineum]
MVISSPCLIDNKELTSPKQTDPGKDFSNPLIVDSLLKTIWSSMHHVFTMKHWLVESKRLLMVVAACAYYIWQERNWHLFKKNKRTAKQVIDCIMSCVRLKLLSCKFKKSNDGVLLALESA